jgi:hypothetical protein
VSLQETSSTHSTLATHTTLLLIFILQLFAGNNQPKEREMFFSPKKNLLAVSQATKLMSVWLLFLEFTVFGYVSRAMEFKAERGFVWGCQTFRMESGTIFALVFLLPWIV